MALVETNEYLKRHFVTTVMGKSNFLGIEVAYQKHELLLSTVLNLGRYTGISIEIPVFYLKRYDKCTILPDIILDHMGRYLATWPIYRPISEMNIFDISPRDAFEELLQIDLRSFYKR